MDLQKNPSCSVQAMEDSPEDREKVLDKSGEDCQAGLKRVVREDWVASPDTGGDGHEIGLERTTRREWGRS